LLKATHSADAAATPKGEAAAAPAERSVLAARGIFEHAMTLFEQNGFHRTSMNEIAEACGVTKPTLYYYFRNKSHLLETLYEDITKDFFGQVAAMSASDAPADKRLYELIERQVAYNIGNRRFLSIFWRERHQLDDTARKSLAQIERNFEAMVQNIVDAGLADGTFTASDPKVATYAVLSLLSTVHRWAEYVDRTPQQIADQIASLALHGLTGARD
jgi:AcrR family transcriptional regulator